MSSIGNRYIGMRLNTIDYLRTFAAIAVIFSHSFAIVGLMPPSFLGLNLGKWAVFVFFAISGYLLGNRCGPGYWRKRSIRILPGLITVTFMTVFVLGSAVTTSKDYFTHWETWRYMLTLGLWHAQLPGVFESNPMPGAINGSLWMIPHLFIMYALLFIIVRLGIMRWIPGVLIAMVSGVIFSIDLPQLFFILGACFFSGVLLSSRRIPELKIPKIQDLSFGLFIYSFPIQQLIVYLSPGIGVPSMFMISVVLSFIIAALSRCLVEVPVMRFMQMHSIISKDFH